VFCRSPPVRGSPLCCPLVLVCPQAPLCCAFSSALTPLLLADNALHPLEDSAGEWTGVLTDDVVSQLPLDKAVYLGGRAGTVTVHNARCVHGSKPNLAPNSRPLLLNTFTTASARAPPAFPPAFPSPLSPAPPAHHTTTTHVPPQPAACAELTVLALSHCSLTVPVGCQACSPTARTLCIRNPSAATL